MLAVRLDRDEVLPVPAFPALIFADVFFAPASFEAVDDFDDVLLCGLVAPDLLELEDESDDCAETRDATSNAPNTAVSRRGERGAKDNDKNDFIDSL